MKKIVLLGAAIALLSACADEAAFNSSPRNVSKQTDGDNEEFEADLGADTDYRLVLKPKDAPPVDYLFVVDNSTSMSDIISQMQKGFKQIAERGEFPANAKVGVISTTVPEASSIGAKIVGYKSLVTRDSIKKNPDRAADHGKGCVDGWFEPNEKDGKGNLCLTIATNFKLYGTGVEAGLSAFDNFLTEQKNDSPFREGAALNVVFFSDTHDVGAGNTKLKAKRDSFTVEGFFEEGSKIIKYFNIEIPWTSSSKRAIAMFI